MTFIGLNKYINISNNNQSHKNNTSQSEIIFNQFLDCFFQDQNNNENSYFL